MQFRKILLSVLLGIVALGPVLGPYGYSLSYAESFTVPTAHAQLTADSADSGRALANLQRTISLFLDFLIVVNWVCLSTAQALLDPDVIFGERDASGNRPMEYVLRALWITSRDLVNGIFAFILLGAAIYIIVGSASGGEGGWSKVKSAAPKFVLAVILVNFSWFFPRVIIDFSNVLTSVIFELPFLVGGNQPCIGEITENGPQPCVYVWKIHMWPEEQKVCDLITKKNPPNKDFLNAKAGCPHPKKDEAQPYKGKVIWGLISIYWKEWDEVAKTGIPGGGEVQASDLILNGLGANFAQMQKMGVMDYQDLSNDWTVNDQSLSARFGSMMKYLIKLIFHVLLSFVVGLSLLALTAVLLVRMAVLWICIAFMPFIFLGWALGKGLGETTQDIPNLWTKFLEYTFIPAMVAVPYSVGFMMIRAMYHIPAIDIPLRIVGLDIFTGQQSFHQLIWNISAIAIMWIGVFTVLEKDKISSKFVGGVKSFGQTGLKTVGYGMGYGLQMPIPGGKSKSVMGMMDDWKLKPGAIRAKYQAQERAKNRPSGSPAGGFAPNDYSMVANKLKGMGDREHRDLERVIAALQKTDAKPEQHAASLRDLGALTGVKVETEEQLKEVMKLVDNTPERKSALGGQTSDGVISNMGKAGAGMELLHSAAAPANMQGTDVDINIMEIRMSEKQITQTAAQQAKKRGITAAEFYQYLEASHREAKAGQGKDSTQEMMNEMNRMKAKDMTLEEFQEKILSDWEKNGAGKYK